MHIFHIIVILKSAFGKEVIKVLKRLFIKDFNNTSDPKVRNRYGVVSGVFGIVTNFLLFLIKLIIGLISNSITIIADAINNLSDAGSSVLTMIGFKLAGKPADKDHPYGHARYEQITALLVAILVLCIGVLFAKGSVEKIFAPEELSISAVTYITLVAAIILKLVQMFTYLDFAKAIDSDTIRAAALDSRNDVISTASVLVSIIIMGIFNINIDGWVGLIVSVFLVWSAIKMVKETIDPMLGIMPSKELVDSLTSLIMKHEGIIDYHDLIIHNYGVGQNFASVHVEIDASGDIIAIHDLIDNIEHQAHDELGILLTIHMDPVDVDNPKRQKLLELCRSALSKYDQPVPFHDFRIVDGPTHTNILFDIVEPFDTKFDMDKIKALLSEEMSCEGGKYYYVINVDKAMTDEN